MTAVRPKTTTLSPCKLAPYRPRKLYNIIGPISREQLQQEKEKRGVRTVKTRAKAPGNSWHPAKSTTGSQESNHPAQHHNGAITTAKPGRSKSKARRWLSP